MRRRKLTQDIDWITVLIYGMLTLIGWLAVYSAQYDDTHPSIFDFSKNYGKQFIWMISAFSIATLILMIDSKFFSTFSYPIYFLFIFFLAIVLIFGKEVAGNKAWFQIGAYRLQPSEFAKFALNLALAKYLSTLNINMKETKTRLRIFGLISLPMILILLQKDTGSAIVFLSFFLVLFREGLPSFWLILGLSILLLCILALLLNKIYLITALAVLTLCGIYLFKKNKKIIFLLVTAFIISSGIIYGVNFLFDNFLRAHQRQRIEVLLGKELDLKGAAYNVNQSKIAIGSGGFWGKGYLSGTQTKFEFVPEQSTDFIFCTIGEEFGFFGSSLVLLIFLTLLLRTIFIAERQRSKYSRIYAYGVASVLFMHMLINIGMTIGLAPVIGIPFPFISYGGSSLWAFTILVFILLRFDADRLTILR